MLISLHHHLEARDQNLPRDVTSTELVQHAIIDVIHVQSALTCFYCVSLVEGERLTKSFVLCK
jgi:hypothetical protein